MKNKLLVHTCLALLLTFVFAACDKDKDGDEQSKTDILTSGQWRVTAARATPAINIGGFPVSDVYAVAPACIKDNYYIFKTDGNAEWNEGPTKCNAADPQTISQPWSLSDDEKTININNQPYNVLELTQTTLRVSGNFTYPVIGTIPAEVTFTKQ